MSILSRAIDANRKTASTGSKQTNKKDQEGRTTTARPSLPTASAGSDIRSLAGGVATKLPTAGPSRLEQAISASRRGETVRPQSWTDAESGFDSWLQEVNSFAQRMSQDYTKRSGKYQDAATMSKYRSAADSTISQMENRSKSYREFFSTRRDLYGDEEVDRILSALDEGDKYLSGVSGSLGSEYDFWAQFEDEDDYNTYKKGQEYAALGDADREIGQYGKGNIDLYNRPQYQNADGSVSTVDSTSFNIDGKEVLLPTVWMKDGKAYHSYNDEEILQHYYETGEYLGKFDTVEEANAYGDMLHNAQDFYYGSQYRTTANGHEAKLNYFTGKYTETGYDDILYDAINGDETARSHLLNSYTTRNYDLDSLTQDQIQRFNYLYATQGADAAYEYLDADAGREYTGIDAIAYGALQGTGLTSISALLGGGYAKLTGDDEAEKRNQEWYGEFLKDAAGAQEQHPYAYGAGSVGGNLALLYGVGAGLGAAEGALATGVQIGGKTVAVQMAPAVQGIVNSGLSFLAADAAQNAGAAATGYIDAGDYLKSIGISGAQGIAGGLAGGLVGSGMAKILKDTGMMTPFMEFVRQTTTGFASAGANIGTGYALRDEKPTNEQIATDLTTAFLFSVIQGGISTYKTTQTNKAKMSAAYEQIVSEYSRLSQGWEQMTPEARADAAARIAQYTQNLRTSLNSYYMAGQQASVDTMNQALDAIEAAMNQYVSGFASAQAATAAPGNLLGSAAAGTSGTQDGADLAAQVQQAVELGLTAFHENSGNISGGMNPADTTSGIVPAAAANGEITGTDILSRAAEQAAQNGSISGKMADRILADQEAVSALMSAIGHDIPDDMPQAQRRQAVKTAVDEFARRQSAVSASGSEVIPLESGSAQTETQEPQRTDAIMVRDMQAVERFGHTIGKAGAKALSAMYDPSVSAETYLRGMNDYYNAGLSGTDLEAVDGTAGAGLSSQQKEAAYLAGQADAASKTEVTSYGTEEGQVYLRNGSERADSADTGRELRPVAESAGRDQGWEVTGRPADSGASALSYGEAVSTASLGIGKGSANDSIRLITGGETEAMKSAKAIASERGLRVTFFAGSNLTIQNGEQPVSARAYISGDRAFIRVDHPEYTADQLMRHEAGHDMIAKGEIDPEQVRQRINDTFGKEKTDALADQYEAAYRGSGLTADEVWEEVICDSIGDMNIFHDIPVLEGNANELLEETKAASVADLEANRTRGPPPADAAPDGKESRDLEERRRALRKGEMVNQFRDKINWPAYYQELTKSEYNPDFFDDGAMAYMSLDGSLLTLEMQRNGEWSVIDMKEVIGYGDTGSERGRTKIAAKDGAEGLPGQREDDGHRSDLGRAGAVDGAGGASGQRGNGTGDGEIRSADYEAGARTERNGVKEKFSMETPIEETKNLLAIHNKDEASILSALELGGLPMPSIAVVKAKDGHSQYGPISLVFGKDTIDPQADRRNKVYGSDAWTPTHSDARVDYEVDYDVKREFEQNIETLANDVAGGIFSQSSVLDMAGVDDQTSMSVEEIAHRLATRYDSVRAAYLANRGQDIDIVYRTKEFDSFGNDALKSYLDKVGEQEAARLAAKMLTGERLNTEEVDTVKDAIMESWTAKNEWRLNKKPELRETRIAKQREKLSDLRAEDFARNAWDFYEDGGTTTDEVNRMETAENLRHAVDDKAVEAWVLDMLRGLTGEPAIYNGSDLFDARGNRKSFKETHWSYTLENIVRAMNNAKTRGQGMWGMSGSGLVATATPAYNSVQEMHADESRLRTVDSSEYEQMVKDLDGELDRVAADIMHTTEHHASNTFEEEEIIGDVIAMAAQGKRTTAGVKQTFRKEGYTISDKQASAVLGVIEHASRVPTGYFEAKPQRAVGFDEVLAAVIPDDSSEKLRTGLEQAGVRMLEYKSGDDADRLAKVNSVEDAKFSQEISALNQMRKDSQGRTLTEQQREYFKDSKTVDDQGRLMVMYHGTRKGGFTVFRDWSYLTENRKYAERYMDRDTGETMYEVYANIKNPFDTRLEECRTIWENEFYGEYSRTALQESGLPDWTDGYDLVDFLEDNGYDYDAILLDEGADQINGSVVERGISYVVRSSEQIKSVDNKTPTDNPDIRFSQDIAELDALRKENERLKVLVEHWKGQLKQTTPETRTLRQEDVDKLARRLVKEYGGTLDASIISGKLKSLGEFIIRGGDGKDELTWAGVHEKALDIARDLVENAVVMNDDMYREYSDLRNYLRTTKIIYGKEYHGDIPDYGDFRKGQFGRLNLGSDGTTNIDQVYQDLSSRWPEFFNEQEQSHPTDQLLQIVDVLDGLQPIYENPYSYDMAAAEEYAAGDILDSLMGEDVRQEPPTYADRQARRLEDAKAKGRQQVQKVREQANERLARQREQSKQRMQTAIARERKRRDERVQQLKDHYSEVRKNQAARRADSKARTRLLNIARRLQNKKLPAVNRALLDQYIGDLDTVSRSMTGKTLDKLSDLKEWYEGKLDKHSPTYDPDFISDPNIDQALARLSKRHIADMTADEVADLTRILLNIENELRTEHKLIDEAERRDTYHLGQETIQDIYNTKGSRGVLDKFIVTETLSPLRQVRRMTGYVDSDPLYKLTQSLADGQRSMLDYQMKAERPFEKFASDKAFSKTFSGPKAEAIQITGLTKDGAKTVTITPAMRVSLYLHSLNDQNLRHIKEGGITVPDEKLYRKGKLEEAYARGTTIKLTPSQVRAITASMTEKEKAFARAAHKYFNETSRAAINATSEKLKGYSLAQVDNYFPINTDSSFTRSEFETLKRDGTIEGMGFLKERVRASNPVLLRDANSVLEQAIRMHGKYVGLAIPVRNFNKVWSVTTGSYNEDGSRSNYDSSVQQAVKQRWGDTGYGYIEKLMTDLQGGSTQKNVWVKALNKVRSNYAGAVLTLNLSVAMKQAASYPTAAAVLGWKPLARAMADFGKVDLDRIEKYTPLQWYRSKGFSTKELGDLKTADRQLPPVLNWVQGVDLLTTRKLWKASEYYVRQNNKELSVGTDAYWRAVADIYNRVIEETQPNYTTMQRPQLLRNDDSLLLNLSMFKTQPFQNFNIVYDAAGNYIAKAERARNGGEQEKADAKKAKSDLGHAITSQLAQLAVFAGMTMVWALLRGKTSKYEDDDGDMTVSSVLSALGKDMAGGALSSVPFGSDAWELLSSKVFGDTYYGMDAVTVTAISDTIQALGDLSEQMGRIIKNAATGKETNWNSERLKLDRELDSISKAAGVPYENVVNMFKIAFLHTAVASQGEYLGGYAYLKLTTDPEKYASDYYDLLFRSMQNSKENYETIYADMVKQGYFASETRTTEEAIADAMEQRMKDAQGVKKVSELDRRYLSPGEEKDWDRLYGQIKSSDAWSAASEEQRSGLEEDLYDLVTGTKAGEKLREKIDAGAAFGIDDTDYLLYRLALSITDKPTESGNMGSYTNDEVEQAINMLTGLSNDARSYLWTAQGKSEKSNPWG